MIDAVFVGFILAAAVGVWLAVVCLAGWIWRLLIPDETHQLEQRHDALWRKAMEQRQRRLRGMRP